MNAFSTPQKREVSSSHRTSEQLLTAREATTLPRMLLARCQGAMDDIAIADATQQYSYEATLLRAVGIAVALRARGAAHNECVGLFVDSSADLALSMWGILLSGSPYLPLATDYPQDRLAYMLRDATVQLVLTNTAAQSKLDGLLLPHTTVLNIDDIALATVNEIDQVFSELVKQDADDLAYVIYTSGTTGKPKGVKISHRAIVNQMNWIASEGYLLPGERILQKTPVSFDAAQWELLGMCCGARVVMGTPGVSRDPEALVAQIRHHGVTTLQGVPTLLQALTELDEFAACTSLHSVFSGGEALSRRLAKKLLEVLPAVRLVNLYGPTECTINATHFRIDDSSFSGGWEIAPIGRPVGKLSCYVLDADLAPVRPGEAGELFIRGEQLARGYLFQPDQTEAKFPQVRLPGTSTELRLYRTGDIVKFDGQGVLHFIGRTDNQVKFRGHRIELDEIRLAIENHDWVKSAAVFIKENEKTGQAQLVGAVELNPNEARLMDHGVAESHHQTKSTRIQIRAQLSGRGQRGDDSLDGMNVIRLPGRQETDVQRERVFARKTYRFFQGGPLTASDLHHWLGLQLPHGTSTPLGILELDQLGSMLRYLGQFESDERLLPKFAYASPGALYATQVCIELNGIAGLAPGHYYYHPKRHSLHLLSGLSDRPECPRLRLHFVGNPEAIREVYKNNIREVLDMEAGHILGMLDHILPEHGLAIGSGTCEPAVLTALSCPPEHELLGSFDIVALADRRDDLEVDACLQAHGGRISDLVDGTYLVRGPELQKISSFVIEQRHVIAINQQTYQRASGGISLVSRSPEVWRQYIDLGRSLQRLQMNRIGIGTMSSGYSSKSGNDLATALRLNDILARADLHHGPSYFCLFGKISAAQERHRGMDEDAVHMKGPAELIRADLFNALPDYMVPGKIFIVNKMPHSASGKVDVAALKRSDEFNLALAHRPVVGPRNDTEAEVCCIWRDILQLEEMSIDADFFELGGNSLQAVAIARAINRRFKTTLPIQVIFSAPTVDKLAALVNGGNAVSSGRAVLLAGEASGRKRFCWPGLGGYPMNLRMLGEATVAAAGDAAFYGVQALGINTGETAFDSIEAMAAEDIRLIRKLQPEGPYQLWGYSFGARIAYEVAHQLERQGEVVERLVLLAPGSPRLAHAEPLSRDEAELFNSPAFLTILLSVLAHTIDPALNERCLATVRSRAEFIAFAWEMFPTLDPALLDAIVNVVAITYSPTYQVALFDKPLSCPISVWRASGDGDSFICNGAANGLDLRFNALAVGHYEVLAAKGISELMSAGLL